jgi:hypothetical protein
MKIRILSWQVSCLLLLFLLLCYLFHLDFFFNDFEQKVIVQARKNRIAKKFPHLICAEHLTRTFMESHFIYSAAICRNDANCSSENIIVAKELIGFIGKREQKEVNDGKYYVELFNNGNQNVINGDYDII